jgi:hypothetical protein
MLKPPPPNICRHALSALILAGAVSLPACGSSSTSRSQSSPGKPPAVSASLRRPLFAPCVPKTVGKPGAARITATFGPKRLGGWRVTYTLAAATGGGAKQTTLLLLLEYPPALPSGFINHGHFRIIAGRRVSFLVRPAPTFGFAARWKTRSALYIVIANGTRPAVLERVIGCLP